jgi:hypothetical protein
MSALKPGLLDRLRQERINIDWRRERPHPNLAALRAEFEREVEEGQLDHCERVEAGALLSRLALEPLATLQGLIDVLDTSPSRSGAALRLLQELSFQWGAAMAALGVSVDGEKARQVAHHSATVWMRRLAKRYPQDRRVQHAVAVFLRRGHSRSALFQHVERQAEPCPEVVAEYFDAVIDALSRNPDPNMLKRAFLEPLPFKAPFSFDLVCFRFHRAVVAHVLIWNCDFRASFGNAALRAGLLAIPKPDPASELEAVRRLLSLQPWDSQAECVIRLCKCPAIWSCPDLEAVRLDLLELATSMVPHVQDMDVVKRLLRCLIEYAPQTLDFWDNPARPRQLHELVVARKNQLSPAVHGSFVALTAFALPDLDMVACGSEASAAGSISSPSQLTYLDPRKVARRTAPILLNADRFSLEAADMSSRPDGFVVATSADENYFRIHAMTWAESLQRSGSGADVHFHIIGAPDAISSEMAAVRKALARRRVTLTHPLISCRRFSA